MNKYDSPKRCLFPEDSNLDIHRRYKLKTRKKKKKKKVGM
jgi:hypothetical protein